MFFSIIIPLFNRPEEIRELLQSLLLQTYKNFEVVIVEDGSSHPAEELVLSFADRLQVSYYFKPNEGQGFARNYGFANAKGDFFIVFDSDVIVPEGYLETVKNGIENRQLDAFGGPDAAHDSFTPIQKAISYSMTSPFTTGGIRGNKKHVGQFHPRSFNMGISRRVWQETKGYKLSRRSEDIEFSIRMIRSGYKVELIPDAFVYHKRRTSLSQFFKQIYGFGQGRIDIDQLYPGELKLIHTLPAVFTLAVVGICILHVLDWLTCREIPSVNVLAALGRAGLGMYCLFLFMHSLVTTKNFKVAVLSVFAAFTQLMAYGFGFMRNYIDRVWLKKDTAR